MIAPSPYGMTLSLSLLLGFILAWKRLLRQNVSENDIANLALVAAPFMLAGSRLHHVITDWYLYVDDPIRVFYFWQGGLGFWGALFGGLLAVYVYCHKVKISIKTILNSVAPQIFLVIGAGRLANVVNNELLPFAYYDSVINLLLFFVFIFFEKRNKFIKENVFLSSMLAYAVTRFFLEFTRTEPKILAFLTINQFVSLFVAVAFAYRIVRIYLSRKTEHETI